MNNSNRILPWQHTLWQGLMQRLHEDRLPHAMLLTGPTGIGKESFAQTFARAVLCEHLSADARPCGTCRGCLLNQAGTHPDNHWAGLLEDKKIIGVDQVREISASLNMKAHYSGYKVVVISPAECMNTQAANSLLKTLEEPAPRSLLMLVTSNATALPATLRSRCQRIICTLPAQDVAASWLAAQLEPGHDAALLLALAGGAPLAALQMAQGGQADVISQRLNVLDGLERLLLNQVSPVALAAIWLKFALPETLYWVHSYIIDMIRLKSAEHPPLLANPDARLRLQALAEQLNLKTLYYQLDKIREASRLAVGQSNAQMLLEDILINWKMCSTPGSGSGSVRMVKI